MQTGFPYFQPIISVASGRIVGYEVIARHIDNQPPLVSEAAIAVQGAASEEQARESDRQCC